MNIKVLTPFIEGKATMGSLLDSIAKSRDNLMHRIQMALTLTVYFAVKDGNVTATNQFIDKLAGKDGVVGKMVRKREIMAWLERYAPLTWDKDTKTFGLDKDRRAVLKAELDADKPAFLTKFMGLNVADLAKPETEYQGFNFRTRLEKLVKEAMTAQRLHGDDKNVNIDGLAAVIDTMNQVWKVAA